MKNFFEIYFLPPIITKFILEVKKIIISRRNQKLYDLKENDYNARKYWRERYYKYGIDSLRSVGICDITEEENYAWYKSAELIFRGILSELKIDGKARILEIGYGNGFYTNIITKLGYKNYLGVDIVDTTIDAVKNKIEDFEGCLKVVDVGIEQIDYTDADLVFMIDVSQHIVNDKKMSFCLENNVSKIVKNKGFFLVTDELSNKKKNFYEISRDLEFYKKYLKKFNLYHKPIKFRDKYIFSFQKD